MIKPPHGIGVLYDPVLLPLLQRERDLVDYIEIIPDMYWTAGEGSYVEHDTLTGPIEELSESLPVVMHSVGLSIGTADLFDSGHVAQISRWQRRFRCAWHSDHLSFSRVGVTGHDQNAALAIPLPYDEAMLELVCERVRYVQSAIPVPFLLENTVYFFDLPEQEMTEPIFLNRLCHETGCGLLLDLRNVYTNARNHGFDACEFVSRIDPLIIAEMHIAGGDEFLGMYNDSHSGPIAEPVWTLLEHSLRHAPDVRGVTYEFHDSYYPQMQDEGVQLQLMRAREIWDNRNSSLYLCSSAHP
jgi:uncharacterized protein (UPF0276 family)